jgi:hypothetical protein
MFQQRCANTREQTDVDLATTRPAFLQHTVVTETEAKMKD